MDPKVVQIARLNIEHYEELLSREKVEAKRHSIERLLAEEVEKLAALEKAKDDH
jgi:hypothetical protein